MKIKQSVFLFFLFIALAPAIAHAQNTKSNSLAFQVGDHVEADYSTWYPGKIVEVLDNGRQYKVELYPPDGGKPFVYPFLKSRLRPLPADALPPKAGTSSKLVFGKYGCTASSYNNGSVTYSPKGSFVITHEGKYTYQGLEKPSTGTFTVDKDGNLLFKGGYFDGGKAEKIDRPNKFFLVFPANPDHRWTCGLADGK